MLWMHAYEISLISVHVALQEFHPLRDVNSSANWDRFPHAQGDSLH